MDYSYILMTDSDSEMPYRWEEEYDIKTILMPYVINGKEIPYDLGRTVDIIDFYNQMRAGALVTTVALNPEDFKVFWKPYLDAGKDILYVGFSSQLSGTHDYACLARDEMAALYPDRKIILVDSLAISAPLALLIRECAIMRLEGQSIEAVAQWAQDNKQCANAFFTVDDLVYLKRGGRISSAAAFFGGMLEVKPILHITPEGRLAPFEKIKGRKKALKRIVQIVHENTADPSNAKLIVCHADCEGEAKVVAAMLQEALNPKEIILNPVGPVIGAHAGPGTIAICFFGKNREIPSA